MIQIRMIVRLAEQFQRRPSSGYFFLDKKNKPVIQKAEYDNIKEAVYVLGLPADCQKKQNKGDRNGNLASVDLYYELSEI